jgi:hypothetical protein
MTCVPHLATPTMSLSYCAPPVASGEQGCGNQPASASCEREIRPRPVAPMSERGSGPSRTSGYKADEAAGTASALCTGPRRCTTEFRRFQGSKPEELSAPPPDRQRTRGTAARFTRLPLGVESIADVLSHLGSGAVIHKRRLEDILRGADFPSRLLPTGMGASGGGAPWIATQRGAEPLSLVMGPIREDFEGFVRLRLNEYVLHTWDIEATLIPAATLNSEAVESVIDRLELIARFTDKAEDVERPISVYTTDPERKVTLTLGPESVSLTPAPPSSDPALALPAEAFIRLIYGRLDAEHAASFKVRYALVRLRRVFPGP